MSKIFFPVVLFTLLLQTSIGQSQVQVFNTEELLSRLRLNNSRELTNDLQYSEIKGEAYLFTSFEPGSLTLVDGSVYQGKFRYDMYTENFEFLLKDEVYALSNSEIIDFLLINNRKFVRKKYLTKVGEEKVNYFELLVDGELQLFKRYRVLFRKSAPPKMSEAPKPPSFVVDSDPHYCGKVDQPVVRITSKKQLVAFIDQNTGDSKGILKEMKVSVNREADLIRLFHKLN